MHFLSLQYSIYKNGPFTRRLPDIYELAIIVWSLFLLRFYFAFGSFFNICEEKVKKMA